MVEVVVGEAGGPAGRVGGKDLFEARVDGDGAGLVGLPVTSRRRAPAGPAMEAIPRVTASPSCIPDTKNRAPTARSRSGQGWRAVASREAAVVRRRPAALSAFMPWVQRGAGGVCGWRPSGCPRPGPRPPGNRTATTRPSGTAGPRRRRDRPPKRRRRPAGWICSSVRGRALWRRRGRCAQRRHPHPPPVSGQGSGRRFGSPRG
jgi:hypothetical protein